VIAELLFELILDIFYELPGALFFRKKRKRKKNADTKK
jgi:hypothetical protein